MAQKKVFVEYRLKPGDAGYTDRPLGIVLPRRHPLNFAPDPKYEGRRVETFDTEAEAAAFVEAYTQTKAFHICSDLLSMEEQNLIRKIVRDEIARHFAASSPAPAAPPPPAPPIKDQRSNRLGK